MPPLSPEDIGFARTWKTTAGNLAALPITQPDNPALVHDYQAEGLLVDFGSLYTESGSGATSGRTGRRIRQLTKNSPRNHTDARRPFNAPRCTSRIGTAHTSGASRAR
jgi:hypothetical protein